jgi:Cys-tRNA(Pro) deacylase
VTTSSDRVQAALVDAGSKARVVLLAHPGRTASEAAGALGVEIGQIVKSLVFQSPASVVLLLVAGDRRVDTDKVAQLLGGGPVTMATPETVRQATGFAIGGVSPVGHREPMAALIDKSLERFDTLWAAAGAPEAVFETTISELAMLTSGALAEFTLDPSR